MNYPLISEYVEAIKAAEENFEQLNHLRPVLDEDGEPIMSSGNFALVFKMKDEQTGKLHAVKCFLKEQEGRAEAYRMIAEEWSMSIAPSSRPSSRSVPDPVWHVNFILHEGLNSRKRQITANLLLFMWLFQIYCVSL